MKFNNVVVLFFLLLLQVNTSIASTSSDELSKRVDAVVDFHGIIPSNFSEPLGMKSCFVAHEYTVPSTEPKTSKLHQREPYIYFNVVHSSVNGSDSERRIYFPKNGVQPTADEAVAYSLADIQDGRIDGPDRSLKIPLGNLYWPREKSVTDKQWRERLSVSAIPWLIAMPRQKEVVNFEEVRTILGSSATSPDFQNEDDLSENLYRYSLGYPLRFGYRSSIAYYEDASVVRRAVSCCQVAALNHGILPPQIIATGIVPPHITLGDALYGIGGCVHSKSIVESAK